MTERKLVTERKPEADDASTDVAEQSASQPASLPAVRELLERYRLRAHRMARAQYLAGKRANTMHQTLGIPVVVLTAVVGTAIFATLGTSPSSKWIIGVGLLSLLATILAALQTFLGYSQRAERSRTAAVAYGQLKRDLDLLAMQFGVTPPTAAKALDVLRPEIQRFALVEKESGSVADRFYNRARREERKDDESV